MDLSIVCTTKLDSYSTPFLLEFSKIAESLKAEFVVLMDSSTPDMRQLVVNARILPNTPDSLQRCRGKWILRMEDDEKMSAAMIKWLTARHYREKDSWKFCRTTMWSRTKFLMSDGAWPDHQTRLALRHQVSKDDAALAPVTVERYRYLIGEQPSLNSEIVTLGRIGNGYVPGWKPMQSEEYASHKAPIEKAFQMGMFQHRDEIAEFLRWLGPIKSVLEIGCHRGGTTTLWCSIAEKVVSVDLPGGRWGGLPEPLCICRNEVLKKNYPQFVGLLGSTRDPKILTQVSEIVPEASVDLLYIDGDHSFEGVRADYNQYSKFVRLGGVIAFHDINDTQLHRDRGVQVPKFWKSLHCDKFEFSVDGDWGGIGALRI